MIKEKGGRWPACFGPVDSVGVEAKREVRGPEAGRGLSKD